MPPRPRDHGGRTPRSCRFAPLERRSFSALFVAGALLIACRRRASLRPAPPRPSIPSGVPGRHGGSAPGASVRAVRPSHAAAWGFSPHCGACGQQPGDAPSATPSRAAGKPLLATSANSRGPLRKGRDALRAGAGDPCTPVGPPGPMRWTRQIARLGARRLVAALDGPSVAAHADALNGRGRARARDCLPGWRGRVGAGVVPPLRGRKAGERPRPVGAVPRSMGGDEVPAALLQGVRSSRLRGPSRAGRSLRPRRVRSRSTPGR